MKFLCFADIHENITIMRKLEKVVAAVKPDFLICAGDFTVFEQHIDEMMDWFQRMPVPALIVHGNHEDEAVVRAMTKHKSNIHFIHKHPFEAKDAAGNDVLVIGWGGGGFATKDGELDQWARAHEDKIRKAAKVIFVTHGPPHGTKLDHLYHDYVGNRSYTAFIKRHANILFAISGHLHENFQKEDRMGRCKLVNPGPSGAVITV
jgi:Icc-related predicted phosphoesterase